MRMIKNSERDPPDAEIGSAIVDDDWSGGREEVVIGLSFNF